MWKRLGTNTNPVKVKIRTLILFLALSMSVSQPMIGKQLSGEVEESQSYSTGSDVKKDDWEPDLQPDVALQIESHKQALLNAGIQHSERLPPFEANLSVGATFDQKNLPQPSTTEDWYRIPNWLGGFIHSDADFQIGPSKLLKTAHLLEGRYGCQKDAAHNTWDCNIRSVSGAQDRGSFIDWFIPIKYEPIKGNEDQHTVRIWARVISVNKLTGVIFRAHQEELFTVLSMTPAGQMRDDGLIAEFDTSGNFIATRHQFRFFTVVKPFQQIDSFRGKDLKRSFTQYLISHGLSDLVPKSKQIGTNER